MPTWGAKFIIKQFKYNLKRITSRALIDNGGGKKIEGKEKSL
jgi:hypothetical protein